MTLHSLNALRVIAEFIVVSSHLTSVENSNKFPHSFGGAGALMSFFFVLSGFVAMYSSKSEGVNRHYLTRRLERTYPFFLLMWVLGLPAYVVDMYVRKRETCIVQRWIYVCLQPLCLEAFLGWQIEGSNTPLWYYTSLVFMWALYSRIDVKQWIGNHPLKWIVGLYVASLLLNCPFFIFDGSTVQQLPLLHAFEFFMGCAAAVSCNQGKLIRGEIPAILFVLYIGYACCTVRWPQLWEHSVIDTERSCDFWQRQAEYSFQPGKLVTITSIVWVFVIHWVASSEIRGDSNMANRILQLDVFKSLAKFSLQVYLSHTVTGVWLEYTLRGLNILEWFSKDFHVVFAYCTSYACSIHVQPRLDALVASKTTNHQEKQSTTV